MNSDFINKNFVITIMTKLINQYVSVNLFSDQFSLELTYVTDLIRLKSLSLIYAVSQLPIRRHLHLIQGLLLHCHCYFHYYCSHYYCFDFQLHHLVVTANLLQILHLLLCLPVNCLLSLVIVQVVVEQHR